MVDDTSKLKFVIRPRIGETLPQRSTFLGHPPSKESVPFKPISKANPGILKFTFEGVQISPGSVSHPFFFHTRTHICRF